MTRDTDSLPNEEREITRPVDLCLPGGRLNPDAVGWSRHPLHRCNLRNRWGRKKRWDYWCITTTECMLALTYADLDYLGLVSAAFLDFRRRRWLENVALVPFARGFRSRETVGGADIRFERRGLRLAIRDEPAETRLSTEYRARSGERVSAEVRVALPPAHETTSVVVPFDERDFQYTSKHNARPATGTVEVDGREYAIEAETQGFGCLDFGRGVWPHHTVWNWAAASGMQSGVRLGLQLGGKWTDGTGATENAVCIDGRLHKIGERVAFHYDRRDFSRPWRIVTEGSRRVALSFEPFHERRLRANLRLAGGAVHQCFGHFHGSIEDDTGHPHQIRHLLGWAEEVDVRW